MLGRPSQSGRKCFYAKHALLLNLRVSTGKFLELRNAIHLPVIPWRSVIPHKFRGAEIVYICTVTYTSHKYLAQQIPDISSGVESYKLPTTVDSREMPLKHLAQGLGLSKRMDLQRQQHKVPLTTHSNTNTVLSSHGLLGPNEKDLKTSEKDPIATPLQLVSAFQLPLSKPSTLKFALIANKNSRADIA